MPGLTVEQMLPLAWTWQGPKHVVDEDGDRYEMRVAELPDFFLAAESYEGVLRELRPALRTFLETYAARGDEPTLPDQRLWRIIAAGPRAQAPKPPQFAPVPVLADGPKTGVNAQLDLVA